MYGPWSEEIAEHQRTARARAVRSARRGGGPWYLEVLLDDLWLVEQLTDEELEDLLPWGLVLEREGDLVLLEQEDRVERERCAGIR